MNGFKELNAMKELANDFIDKSLAFIDRQRKYQELNKKEEL